VTDPLGNAMPASAMSVTFNLPTGDVTIGVSQIFINPNYIPATANRFNGGDIAVIELASTAPTGVQGYGLYRNTDEIGQVYTRYGYGVSGTGATGGLLPYGVKREGENTYDALASVLGDAPDLLAYDFDDGTAQNDAFGQLFGIHNLGLGAQESCADHGDSGGPAFINGLIAGECTGGFSPGPPIDVNALADSSFGEFGEDTRVSTYAPWIDQVCTTGGVETPVNQFTRGTQKWSSVSMDENGDFVVTWTSYNQDTPGGLNGVYARRFNNTAQPVGNEFLVNSYTPDNQQRPRVAMDAAGDFTVAWESYQDPVQSTDPPGANATYGVYAQQYVRAGLIGTSPFIGANGELGGEFQVNGTVAGDQRFPSVGADHTGDYVIVWSGNGTSDPQGVFYNRYEAPSDTAGPIVADTLRLQQDTGGKSSLWLVRDGSVVTQTVPQFVVDFDENLMTTGGVTGIHSVLNPNNWVLTRNGVPISGAIASVDFGLSEAYLDGIDATPSDKYQAVVKFDGDPTTPALDPLGAGQYVLTVHDTVQDVFKNPLDGNYDGIPRGDFHRTFTIQIGGAVVRPQPPGPPAPGTQDPTVPNISLTFQQDSPAVASDSQGNYVVVWVTYGQFGDLPTEGNIMAQRFDRTGQRLGTDFVVNSTVAGIQIQPDVAMDPYGNFVVVWSGQGLGDTSGVFGRRFDAFGVPQGPEFLVNAYTNNVQDTPAVAMDPNGDFVVTWNSYNNSPAPFPTPDRYGVWARRYNSLGVSQHMDPPAGTSAYETVPTPTVPNPGVLVNAPNPTVQKDADVAMDANGNFTIVWQSDGQDGSSWGIYGQQFNADGSRQNGEFPVNVYNSSAQIQPRIAMDPVGDYVVAWSSFYQDGNGYGVYARRYDAAKKAMGPEFRVNEDATYSGNQWTTNYWQWQPAVAMSANGQFVVTWTTGGQRTDANDFDIHARLYDAILDNTGVPAPLKNPNTGLPWDEFLINAYTPFDQVNSDVAMDAAGNFIAVWVGPDPTIPAVTSNVFYRIVNIGDPSTSDTNSSAGFEGWSGGWSTSDGGIAPTSQLLTGTATDDQVNVTLGQTPSTWQVQLNGVAQQIGGHVALVEFDGRGGNNTLNVTGTAAPVKIEIWPDHSIFTGNGFTFTTANTGTINFTGVSGADQVIFHDSGSGDMFTFRAGAKPGASLAGTGYTLNVANVSKVQALAASGGNNVAQLYGASGTNTFTGTPTYAVMSPADSSYLVTATGYDAVRAYAGSGGTDTARLYDDSNSDETFVANSASATLSSSKYSRQVNGFRYVFATSSGGTDAATLQDPAGNETFDAYPTYAAMYNNASYIRANAFKKVTGQSSQGTALARLYGTGQSDQFTATTTDGHLSGTGYDSEASNFRYCMAYGNGGSDSATLYPSSGSDTYVGTSGYGVLYSGVYYDRATGFSHVEVDGTAGSANMARLYDFTGNDSFTADPTSASLTDPASGASHVVKNFRTVYAYSTAGGTGTATLTAAGGSAGTNTLDAYPTYASLSGTAGSGYHNVAVGFSSVTAVSFGNVNDIARLHDSPGNDTFNAYPTTATLSGTGFSEQANSFRNVYAYSQAGGTDTANLYGSSGDDAFVGYGPRSGSTAYGMLSGATYRNRANGFAEVFAFAGVGGTDTAALYDSSGNDYFWGQAADAVLSDGTLDASGNLAKPTTYYNRVSGFGSATVDGSAGGTNNRKISPVDYALAFTGTWLGDPWS
jgi:hypothetical protein